jgi:hypothetical protein
VPDAIERLRADFPWPPFDSLPEDFPRMNRGNVFQGLAKVVSFVSHIERPVIVELGSEVGGSARYFCEHLNQPIVICLDLWPTRELSKGFFTGNERNPTGDERLSITKQLGTWAVFAHQTREFKDQIIPMHGDRLESLRTIGSYGVVPDLVYVDCIHKYRQVTEDLELVRTLFHGAILTGDDWAGPMNQVRAAVKDFSKRYSLPVDVYRTQYVFGHKFAVTLPERAGSWKLHLRWERRALRRRTRRARQAVTRAKRRLRKKVAALRARAGSRTPAQ